MDKMMWSKPEMNEFAFAANEYVAAACGDENKKYLFTCDAGGGKSGYVWIEDNKKDGLQSDKNYWDNPSGGLRPNDSYDRYLSTYHACGETHEASTTDDFYDGYYLAIDKWNDGKFSVDDVFKVKIWRGRWGLDTHCTTKLDVNTWQTTKS